jgi:hypothetical protein
MNANSFRTRRDAIVAGLGLTAAGLAAPAQTQPLDAGENAVAHSDDSESAARVVEIRSYKLKPGSGAQFHDLVTHESAPLLQAVKMDVIGYGQSLHDPDAYYLIRAYQSAEHRIASQDAFYSSSAWRQGPREAILALILVDMDTVLSLSIAAVEALRQSMASR